MPYSCLFPLGTSWNHDKSLIDAVLISKIGLSDEANKFRLIEKKPQKLDQTQLDQQLLMQTQGGSRD